LGQLNAHPWGLIGKCIAFLIIAFLFYACSGQPIKPLKTGRVTGIYHRVKRGEDLSHIARAYRVDVQELAEANNIQDPNRIEPDNIIFIPDAKQVVDDVMASVNTKGPAASIALPKVDQTKAKPVQKIDQPPARPVQKVDRPPLQVQKSDIASAKPLVRETVIRPKAETASGTSAVHIKPMKIRDRLPAAVQEEKKGPGPPRAALREEEKGVVPKPEKEPPARPAEPAAEPVRRLAPAQEPGAPPSDSSRASREAHELPSAAIPRKEEGGSLHFDRKRFIWPVRGRVVSRFGIQPNGMYYNGITIVAREGMPVVAAAGGTVIFSGSFPGSLKDYGETIIIQHEEQYATVYTHLGQRKVKVNDRVRQSDTIGHLGKGEEKGGGARLTLEIRYRSKARNPMFFLP
jgi:murein DD-endopeptidase MepM/ murein hydrolase activator NlpD